MPDLPRVPGVHLGARRRSRTHRLLSLTTIALLLIAACSPRTARPVSAPSSEHSTAAAEPLLRFAAVGDIGDGSVSEARVARAIAGYHSRRPIDLLLLLGDLIYPDGDPSEFASKFTKPYEPVTEAGIDLAAVLGNHDLMTDPAGIMKAVRMPARSYTFSRGPVRFFALDTSTGAFSGSDRRWLERELGRSTEPWKVAFMHVPVYSAGFHGSSPGLGDALEGLFDRYDVQLALAGHDHDYQRSRPIRGTTYLVSGGGCCPRKARRAWFTARSVTGLGFVVIEASPSSMSIEAVSVDGRVVDRSTIEVTQGRAA